MVLTDKLLVFGKRYNMGSEIFLMEGEETIIIISDKEIITILSKKGLVFKK